MSLKLPRWLSVVKNPPANAGDTGDRGSIPVSGRCPGGGHGNPLQYSCLESPMDRGAWWATVHGVTNSRMQQHAHTHFTKKENILRVAKAFLAVTVPI